MFNNNIINVFIFILCDFISNRFQKQHVLLGGMWFSKIKPPKNTFLFPIIKEMNALFETGILFSTSLVTCDVYMLAYNSDPLQQAHACACRLYAL